VAKDNEMKWGNQRGFRNLPFLSIYTTKYTTVSIR